MALDRVLSFLVRVLASVQRVWSRFVSMGLGSLYRRRVKVFSVAILIYLDYKVKLLFCFLCNNVPRNKHFV